MAPWGSRCSWVADAPTGGHLPLLPLRARLRPPAPVFTQPPGPFLTHFYTRVFYFSRGALLTHPAVHPSPRVLSPYLTCPSLSAHSRQYSEYFFMSLKKDSSCKHLKSNETSSNFLKKWLWLWWVGGLLGLMKQGKSRSESGFSAPGSKGVSSRRGFWPVARLAPPPPLFVLFSGSCPRWAVNTAAGSSKLCFQEKAFLFQPFQQKPGPSHMSFLEPAVQSGLWTLWPARCRARALHKRATSGWKFVGSEVGFLREKPRHDGWKKGFWTSKYQICPPWFQPKPPYLVKQGPKLCLTAFDILTGSSRTGMQHSGHI